MSLIFLAQLLGYTAKGLLGFGKPLISGPILSMMISDRLGKYLVEKKRTKAAIVLFIAGGVSIIVKSVPFHA